MAAWFRITQWIPDQYKLNNEVMVMAEKGIYPTPMFYWSSQNEKQPSKKWNKEKFEKNDLENLARILTRKRLNS